MRKITVSSKSRPNAVAGAIAKIMRENDHVQIRVVGGGAVNQAVKSVAIARTYLIDDKIDIVIVPSFAYVEIEGERRTGIYMEIYRRSSEQRKD